MKKKIHIWILAVVAWIMVCLACTPAAASDTSPEQEFAQALVTQIRQDPLVYAQGLGYCPEELVANLPWLTGIRYALTGPAASEFLALQAAVRNSTNLAMPEPDVTLTTDFAAAGDITGVVSFINYVAPETAIATVINHQFKNELNPLYEGKRLLLSPDYPLMGTAFRAGEIQEAGQMRHAYFIHICLASTMTRSAVQVVNLINQGRHDPMTAPANLTLPPNVVLGAPHSPLFLNPALISVAELSLATPVDVREQALYFGFPGTRVASVSVIEAFAQIDLDRAGLWLFSSLLLQEIKLDPPGQVMFTPLVNEIGPALFHVTGPAQDWVKMTVVTGHIENQHPDVSRVYGVAYVDQDGNGVYTPGEEASDRLIAVYDTATRTKAGHAVTNRAGQFVLHLPANREYRIQSGDETSQTGQLIFLTADQYVGLKVK
jgi:hypothetical protein